MFTAEMWERRMRIFTDGAVAAATGEPPTPPKDMGSAERITWFDGYKYKQPGFENPYRIRRHT